MSSAFDIVEMALQMLGDEKNLTDEQRELVSAVQRTVADWHKLNHNQDDVINLKTSPGALVSVVDARNRLTHAGE